MHTLPTSALRVCVQDTRPDVPHDSGSCTCRHCSSIASLTPRHRPSHCHNISLGTPIYPCEPVDGCVAGCNGGLGLDALRHVPAGAAARRS